MSKPTKMPPDLRRSLDIIRAAGPDGMSDDDAAGWAVKVHSHFLENADDVVVMSKPELADLMLAYANFVLACFAGRNVRAVGRGDDGLDFEEADGPMPKKPAGAPVH